MKLKLALKLLTGLMLMVILVNSGSMNAEAGSLSAVLSTTINIPGTRITAMEVYETGNKIILADEISQSLIVLDGTNNAVVATIPSVGAGVNDLVINETYGKVYAASDINTGNGLVSIIDLATNQIITQIDPDSEGSISYFVMANDEVHDKIYLAHYSGVSVMDAATDAITAIPDADAPYPFLNSIGINTVTNEIFLAHYLNGLNIIDGDTLSVLKIPYPSGCGGGLNVAVNEIENKVYMTVLSVPGQPEMGIYILDRDTGAHLFVGANDLEPLAFNNISNQLFTGVEVGIHASIVDGATDQLTELDFGDGGVGDIDIRRSTDHAYLAAMDYTYIVDGTTKTVYQKIPSNVPGVGGLNNSEVAINQTTGLVYVINDFDYGILTVFQDVSTHLVSGNAGVGDAILNYVDGNARTVTADADGDYQFIITNGWSGTVTPSKTGYSFSPASLTYDNVTADHDSQNYNSVRIPGNFSKSYPGDNALDRPLSMTFTWNPSNYVVAYEYCYDISDNDLCNHPLGWRTTAETSIVLSDLAYSTPYYWQVRAVSGWVTIDANAGAWWTFTTQDSPPPNDDFNDAITVALPFSDGQVIDFATTAIDDPVIPCGLGGQAYKSVWYIFTPTKNGRLVINSSGSSYTNDLVVWTGSRTDLHNEGCSSSGEVQVLVAAGATYYIEVASYFSSIISPPGVLNITASQIDAPDAFGKTSPGDGSTDLPANPSLIWETSIGATSYSYCYDETDDDACSSWVNNGTATSRSLSGLKANTTYYWQVRANNAGGDTYANGGYSAFWSFTTTPAPVNDDFDDPTYLSLPFSITQDLTLASSAPDDPNFPCPFSGKYYKTIWYAFTATQDGTLTVDTFSSNFYTILAAWTGTRTNLTSQACNYSPTGASQIQFIVTTGQAYYIEVANFFANTPGNPSLTLHASFTPPPGSFTKTTPADGAIDRPVSNLVLQWEPSAGATSYDYCYYKANGGSCSWIGNGSSTSRTILSLDRNTTYFWQVRARNGAGVSTEADNGTTWSFVTLPDPPATFSKTSPTLGTVGVTIYPSLTLNWGTSTGATSYRYCVDDTFGTECTTEWIVTTDTSVQVSDLISSKQYYWQVKAANTGGETEASGGWFWFYTASLPGLFNKTNPINLALDVSISPTINWGTSSGATSYEYCYDQSDNDECNNIWTSTGTERSAGFTGLDRSTTYYWQVRAFGPGGIRYATSQTDWWSFTTVPPVPSGFNKIFPSNSATDQPINPTLSWGVSTGASSYEYCYYPDGGSVCPEPWTLSTADTSVALTGLSTNTTYHWQVRAVNPGGKTVADSGVWWNFTTVPNPPGGFGKTAPSDGAVNLLTSVSISWGASTGATSYQVCVYKTGATICADDAWLDNGTATTRALTGLLPNTTYYWQVRAINVGGKTNANDGTWWSFTTIPPAPEAFGKSVPTNSATDQPINPTLSWGASTGAVGYEYCYYSSDPADCDEPWTLTTTNTSIAVSGLSSKTTYHWQVRAVNPGGKTPADSGVWWNFTTVPNPPGGFGKTAPSDGVVNLLTSVSISWGASTGATSYQVCVYKTGATICADDAWLNNGTATTRALTGLLPNTTYYWQARAVNPDGGTEADAGVWWSFTTRPRLSIRSFGERDGWVLESTESSSVGGSMNSTATTLRVGDDAADKQYTSILYFNTTSLPDNAVIRKVTIRIKKQGIVGTDPFTTHGSLIADIRKGFFGLGTLELTDFQAAASKSNVGRFNAIPSLPGWYQLVLNAINYPYINLLGTTQFRLRFLTDDNNDNGADYVSFFSGETSVAAAARPVLIIEYILP